MTPGILGKKVGMTRIFAEDGKVLPVTVLKVGPCIVVQRKTADRDGYEAVQLGLVEFIKSKNVEHYAWTVALTRMLSAVFRRGGDVSFVVDELKAVFDPRGGAWIGGRYVPSILAAIGEVIEEHLIRIGFIDDPDTPSPAGGPDPADSAIGEDETLNASSQVRTFVSSSVAAPLITSFGAGS